jgi:hypothetical protein
MTTLNQWEVRQKKKESEIHYYFKPSFLLRSKTWTVKTKVEIRITATEITFKTRAEKQIHKIKYRIFTNKTLQVEEKWICQISQVLLVQILPLFLALVTKWTTEDNNDTRSV